MSAGSALSYSYRPVTRSHLSSRTLRPPEYASSARMPSGMTAVSRSGSAARSTSSRSWKSISSHTLPTPTDSGSRMEMSAWGLKPSEYFSGQSARRNTRCIVRMRSRCEI